MKMVFTLVLAMAVAAWGQDTTVTISGMVKDLRDGKPLAGVSVQVQGAIRRDAPRDPLATAVTGADGRYIINAVEKARARVLLFSAPGHARGMERLPDGAWTDLQTHLAPGADVQGVVVHAQSGAPLAKARVEAEVTRAQADDQGRFTLSGVPLDGEDLTFTVSADGFVPHEIVIPAAELAQPGRAALRIPLEPGHAVVAQVRDAAGKPLAGVTVRARPLKAVPYSGLERANYSAKTDESGIAVVRGLPRQEAVVLEANHAEWLGAQSDPVVASSDPGDGPRRPAAVMTMGPDRSARVRVLDHTGAALSGVRLELLPLVEGLQDFAGFVERDNTRGATQSGSTGADGSAEFRGLAAGAITVEASLPGHAPQLAVLHPERDGESVTITLAAGAAPLQGVPWYFTVNDAWRAAVAQNLPVLFTMAMDGERANDHLAIAHFKDPEVCATLSALPVVLSNVFGKNGVAARGVTHSEAGGLCTRYGGVPCSAHQAVEAYCLDNFGLRGTSFQVPRQILVAPSGEVLEHRVYYLTERDLQRLVVRSIRRVNPAAAAELAKVRLSGLLKALSGAHAQQAAEDLARLAASGDEHAVALFAVLEPAGVSAATRKRILAAVPAESLFAAGSALDPFLADPDAAIRIAAAAQLAAVGDDADVVRALCARLGTESSHGVRAAFEAALGVKEDRSHGVKLRTAHLAPAAKLPVLLALVPRHELHELVDIAAALQSAEPADRARLLRAIAGGVHQDGTARQVIEASARACDTAVLGALEAVRLELCGEQERAGFAILATELSRSSEAHWRLAALRLLLKLNPGPATANPALHDADPEVAAEAALHLLESGQKGVALLVLDLIDDVCHGRRARAALCRVLDTPDLGTRAAWLDLLRARDLAGR